MEFLVKFHIAFPPGTPQSTIKEHYDAEAEAARPYMQAGQFKRVWRIPGTRDHWALWEAPDAETVHAAYASFPMWNDGYGVVTELVPLALNPNDPGPHGNAGLLAEPVRLSDAAAGVRLRYPALRAYLDAHGTPGDAGQGEGQMAELAPGVTIHDHPHSGRPRELHFMVGGIKIAEIGPVVDVPSGKYEDVAPGYVDFMAEWEGQPVRHQAWKDRIAADNGLT